ncbi:inter-alpha-trypsin inhibitor heavy chain H4-like isoform X1 [Diorhabda sublineata]|uniref:inter-alpha-trypsin inhibitor heavy chain H4-like isoform X1 n=1 Tax=Diorhabda sublineata TaxID=1163346 RepID=UPI0024E11378|nr:inter-alpha-trypsin inhibitor heavy chain H4-like isoform X1 [Diorhabda sublineata]XP_056645311.1 inter-alpha-trypsin inhibitor heavy chain H4-like isoform X1 [Diorhabda sublineata]
MRAEVITLSGILISLFPLINSLPQSGSLVTSTNSYVTEGNEATKKQDDAPVFPKIYEMRVEANVSNRFAKCQITSKVKNLDKEAHEATFSVVIPEQAYISGFIMEIDGKQYEAYVQEKEEAKKTYDKAVQEGQGAAHVSVSARDSNRFTVSVNVEPQKKAIFYLKYEELLERQNNQYELVINIHPGQPVKNLDVQVHIDETRPLRFVKAPPLRSGNEISKTDEKLNPNADVKMINASSAVVTFSPDLEQQKQYATDLGTEAEYGLAGQFVVQYDIEKLPPGGEILVDGGHFVHFFSPSDLPALPKQIVFILDTSGSMEGIRVMQLKEAMKSILQELKKEDIFSIVEFGSVVKVWNIDKQAVQYESGIDEWAKPDNSEALFTNRMQQPIPPPYPASDEYLKKAEGVVEKLKAYGGTDIESALRVGLEIVLKNKEDKKHQPIIVFLTDGEATVGETNNDRIISTISELNGGKTPIFSLSFGDGADRNFLQKISLKNLGFNRHIYEGADASLQLQEFYKQISSPLLSNVTFKYVNNVTEVTQQDFPILFEGSDFVISGKILDPGFAPSLVEGWGINGPVKLVPVVNQSVGNLERLWAYLTLKQYLKQREAADNKTGPTQEALRIALKYSFVSDVTSLVVVKPNQTDAVDTEDGSDKRYPMIAAGVPLSANLYHSKAPMLPLAASGINMPSASYSFIVKEEEEEEDLNFFDMATHHSTTPLPIVYTTESTPSPLEQLKQKLPWLAGILNDNGTLNLSKGEFKLGLNETVLTHPECPSTTPHQTGKCTLIHECPQVFTQLTDIQTYEKYFCDLQGFAGVCCPK